MNKIDLVNQGSFSIGGHVVDSHVDEEGVRQINKIDLDYISLDLKPMGRDDVT